MKMQMIPAVTKILLPVWSLVPLVIPRGSTTCQFYANESEDVTFLLSTQRMGRAGESLAFDPKVMERSRSFHIAA